MMKDRKDRMMFRVVREGGEREQEAERRKIEIETLVVKATVLASQKALDASMRSIIRSWLEIPEALA